MKKVVIVNCFDTYEDRVLLLRQFFADRGDEVTVVTSNYRHVKKRVRETFPEGFVVIPTKPYKRNISVDRLVSHSTFAEDVFERVKGLSPDILWVLAPPNSLVKQAAKYKHLNPSVKLIVDVIDMWPETLPIPYFKNLPPLYNWRRLRDKNINAADRVVAECGLYRAVLSKVCPREKLRTLYYAKQEKAATSVPNPTTDRYSLCYLGSINNIIDIPCICNIIKKMPKREKPVLLHIIGDGEQRGLLISEAKKAGAEVIYHGRVYDAKEKQKIFDMCNFGLNIMKENVFVGLTMKSVDYFAGGLPIINNIKGDTWDFVNNSEVGLNYTSDQELFFREELDKEIYRPNVVDLFNKTFTREVFYDQVRDLVESISNKSK